MERWQVNLVQLASTVSTKDFKYLFTMVDHFSKFGWARWIIDIKSTTVVKALRSWMTTHSKPQMIQSDNGSEFTNREFRQYLMELNIEQKFGLPYHPKS